MPERGWWPIPYWVIFVTILTHDFLLTSFLKLANFPRYCPEASHAEGFYRYQLICFAYIPTGNRRVMIGSLLAQHLVRSKIFFRRKNSLVSITITREDSDGSNI
jgi:hypothetical protein